jgi:hypothetical protein
MLHVIPSLGHQRGRPTAVGPVLMQYQVAVRHQVKVATTGRGTRHGQTQVELPERVAVEASSVVGTDRLAGGKEEALRPPATYASGQARALRDRRGRPRHAPLKNLPADADA